MEGWKIGAMMDVVDFGKIWEVGCVCNFVMTILIRSLGMSFVAEK